MASPAVELSNSTDSTAPIMGTASITCARPAARSNSDSITAPAGAIDSSIRCAIPTRWRSRRYPTIPSPTRRHRRRDFQHVNAEPNHVGVARPGAAVSSAGDAGTRLSGSKRELKIATK